MVACVFLFPYFFLFTTVNSLYFSCYSFINNIFFLLIKKKKDNLVFPALLMFDFD